MSPQSRRDGHSVAITGLSCRFPGEGDNLDHFWKSICKGQSAWSTIPKDRFNADAFHSHTKTLNTSVTRGAHFLKQDTSKFDANFFSFSKTEADSMDPQHRLAIEVTYEALEKAGMSLQEVAGTRTGVFFGHFTSDYREMLFRDPESAPTYTASGTCKTSLANRISWLFDLRGPSFSMDTACSSSLVALHLACQSLRTGESDIAIVGGVNLLLNPEMFMYFSNQGFLSPDGKCKSFDISGNGYGRGEGIAALVLKRVDDAISTGDPLRAVIRGTGSNQDGHTKGFTLPSADAQAQLIRDTYRWAGLDFKDTNYVEAHGTGTFAGDTEETTALSRTISLEHSNDKRLLIGSVKSNIGHLEAVAGLAGVIKSLLILEHGMIPPTIHYKTPNPKIKFDEWHLEVPTTLTPWPSSGLRRISVNSFGYGGTNAHAILDDAYHYLESRGLQGHHYTNISGHPTENVVKSPRSRPNSLPTSPLNAQYQHQSKSLVNGHVKNMANGFQKGLSPAHANGHPGALLNGISITNKSTPAEPRLFLFSASDKDGLKRTKDKLAEHLEAKLDDQGLDHQEYLASMAYTLSKKTELQWRTFHVASSLDQLSELLREDETATANRSMQNPRFGFIFTGQGAQWPKMGTELMVYPAFRESVEAADDYLQSVCNCPWSAVEQLMKPKSVSKLHLAEYSQTLCTVLQIAIVDLLKTWKISPVAVAGHSSGEIGAAYCLGALTWEDALRIAYYRGVLSTAIKTVAPEIDGSMMAVGASPEQAEKYIAQISKGEVVIACVNSPTSVTISGDTLGIDELSEVLVAEGIFARKLKVDTAYHSPHMQMVAQEYFEALADIQPRSQTGKCRMHSSVSGGPIEPRELGAANWVRNLTSPVQFASAVYDLVRPMQGKGKRSGENAVDMLIEIGPHSALQGPTTQTLKAHGITNVPYQSVVLRDQDAISTALQLAGATFAQGARLDILQVNNDIDANKSIVKPLIDLPMYQWSHSKSHWEESRIAREYRHRKYPRLSLLGAPASTFTQGEHTWRKFIKLSEELWIADHRVQNSLVYPGAGFLAMAFEAAYQIADPHLKPSAFRLRDVQLTAAAVISEDSDLECILQIRPHFASTRDNASTWMEFVVSTCPDGENLQRNCSGLLLVEYEPKEGSAMSVESELEADSLHVEYLEAASRCKQHIAPVEFYNTLTNLGLIYGPTFSNLTEIRTANGQSFCAIDIPETSMHVLEGLMDRPHIIHPGTLDAMFHAAFAALNGGEDELRQAMVPRVIDEVMVSAKIPFQPKSRLTGFSNAEKHGFKELQADITMFAEEGAHPAVRISGFTCTEIGGSSSAKDDNTGPKKICSKLTWKPAVRLLCADETAQIIQKNVFADQSLPDKIGSDEMLALENLQEVLTSVPDKEVHASHHGFLNWIQLQMSMYEKGQHPMQAMISHARSSVAADGADAKRGLLHENKHRLEALLKGGSSSEHISEAINQLYQQSASVQSIYSQLSEYLELVHFTNPGLSILEISAQAEGPARISMLKSLSGIEQILQTSQYTVSCQNGDAMVKAQEQLSDWKDSVDFGVFDPDTGFESSELKNRRFDVVIAFNIAGSAAHPDVALRNARKLLNEGGEICLIEVTKPGLYLSLLGFSAVSTDSSDLRSLLKRNGLKSSLETGDIGERQLQQISLTTARAVSEANGYHSKPEIIIIEPPNPSRRARDVSSQISDSLAEGYQPKIFTWDSNVSALKRKPCISLLELDRPLLSELSENDFISIKSAITEAEEVFWVVGFEGPSSGMINGLARVVRNELPGIKFRTANLNLISESSHSDLGMLICRAFASKSDDDEYRIQNGTTLISRIQEDPSENEQVQSLLPNAGDQIDNMPLGQANGPQKLAIQTPGMLDSLCFEPDDLPLTELESDQVEIDVKATALNFREIMVAIGQIPDKLLGFDAAGVVRRVGSGVTAFELGDKVAMYGHGSQRTVHRSKAGYCAYIPEGLSFEQAATIPVVHGTAWYALIQLARVEQGQTILIHGGAGGVGQAAIQIALYFGMEVFATVGSEVKRALLRDTYALPDDHILHSRDLSFVKGIDRMTNGRGVDVVLNSLSGEALRQTWHCIAPFGTFIEIGIKDILNNTELDMRPFLQDATYTFFNLNHIERERPEVMSKIISGAFEFQRKGISRPILPLKTYPISEVENAFRLMQAGKHIGKIALTFSDDHIVPVLRRGNDSFHLDHNAAYVVAGGLGGLGRSISTMLVDHGARKLCFLSRSGGSSTEAQKLIQDLKARQVQVRAYRCDISDPMATSKSLSRCLMELGQIRGVIQSAMLLRDVLFTNMTYKQWTESIRPKVQGTWNLHQNLKDVDFFICLSSFAATFGNRGQSNYAAGGAYQDAIAYYRRSLGMHAVTLDVGQMREVGVLAEKGITDSLREWEEPYGILEAELHALLKRVISGDMRGDISPQVLTGLATGGSAIAAGISTPFYLEDNPRFSIMAKTGLKGGSGGPVQAGQNASSTQSLVAKATTLHEAAGYITEALVRRVAKMLQTPESEIDTGRFLHSYGIDSLTAIEVVNWALKELKATVSVIDVMAGVPITATAKKIASSSALYQGPSA